MERTSPGSQEVTPTPQEAPSDFPDFSKKSTKLLKGLTKAEGDSAWVQSRASRGKSQSKTHFLHHTKEFQEQRILSGNGSRRDAGNRQGVSRTRLGDLLDLCGSSGVL